jgi:hypothetical protein
MSVGGCAHKRRRATVAINTQLAIPLTVSQVKQYMHIRLTGSRTLQVDIYVVGLAG